MPRRLAATVAAIAFYQGIPGVLVLSLALVGSLVGFLPFNFNPAKIFLGDSGSLFLGFVLATTSIQTSQKSSTAVAIVVPIIALGVPIADTLLAMARRAARGASGVGRRTGDIRWKRAMQGRSLCAIAVVIRPPALGVPKRRRREGC